MSGPYEDILSVSYPYPTKRKRMSMVERGAQFSPFAALTGFDGAIHESGRLTDTQVDLAADAEAFLDEKLRFLQNIQQEQPEVEILYFEPDVRKSGGAYRQVSGKLHKISHHQQVLVMADGQIVQFSRILELKGEIFRQIEDLYFLA